MKHRIPSDPSARGQAGLWAGLGPLPWALGQFYGEGDPSKCRSRALCCQIPAPLRWVTGEGLLARLPLSPAPLGKGLWGPQEAAVCQPAPRSTGGAHCWGERGAWTNVRVR